MGEATDNKPQGGAVAAKTHTRLADVSRSQTM